ncbi:hypothetical protein [Geodermatophilus normandii]|uniref:Uncharacterized protein n=1 Tax=Geodermatophilus normandii TaxID=1137989 RepID=A0A6P0GL55_9ACTN|nr:hypothetical protein [Geodermatophilus normandii]NEM08049.1 hypothetical protein [Geodermatophilus normandii]
MVEHPLAVLDLVDHLTRGVRRRIGRRDRVAQGEPVELAGDRDIGLQSLGRALDDEPRVIPDMIDARCLTSAEVLDCFAELRKCR